MKDERLDGAICFTPASIRRFHASLFKPKRVRSEDRGKPRSLATCWRIAIALWSVLLVSGGVLADGWPAGTVTIIVPFAAGGPNDLLGRILAAEMSRVIGQQVIVENIPGAGGMVGSRRASEASPDGSIILMGSVGTHAQSQSFYDKPLYNAEAGFTPVILIAEIPIAFLVRKDLPVKTFREFIDYTRTNYRNMNFGSAGLGSATHLACLLVNRALGVEVTHIGFRGGAPALQELAAGRIDYDCDIISTAKPQIEAGTVKALAVLDRQRSAILPDVPTASESGLDVEASTWNAFFLPKNAPATIVKAVNAAVANVIRNDSFRSRVAQLGVRVVSEDRQTPEYLASFLHADIAKWRAVIKPNSAEGKPK